VTPISLLPPVSLGAPTPVVQAPGQGFAQVLGNFVSQAATMEQGADAQVARLAGGDGDVAKAMIALQEAGLAVGLLAQIRDRIVSAYQSLMSMPV
jgi:flagellar hook-basal body complex protein FliE